MAMRKRSISLFNELDILPGKMKNSPVRHFTVTGRMNKLFGMHKECFMEIQVPLKRVFNQVKDKHKYIRSHNL